MKRGAIWFLASLNIIILVTTLYLAKTTFDSRDETIRKQLNELKREIKGQKQDLQNYIDSQQDRTKKVDEMLDQIDRVKFHIKKTANKPKYGPPLSDKLIAETAYHFYYNCLIHPELPFITLPLAVMTQESACRPDLPGPCGEKGQFQILPETWKDCGKGNFNDWRDTMKLGFAILREHWVSTGGNEKLIYTYYNGGKGIYRCKPEAIKRAERYAKNVMAIHGKIKIQFEGSVVASL
jgi:hypothetical protein